MVVEGQSLTRETENEKCKYSSSFSNYTYPNFFKILCKFFIFL